MTHNVVKVIDSSIKNIYMFPNPDLSVLNHVEQFPLLVQEYNYKDYKRA